MSTYSSTKHGREIDSAVSKVPKIEQAVSDFVIGIEKKIEDLNKNKANKNEIPKKTSDLKNDSFYEKTSNIDLCDDGTINARDIYIREEAILGMPKHLTVSPDGINICGNMENPRSAKITVDDIIFYEIDGNERFKLSDKSNGEIVVSGDYYKKVEEIDITDDGIRMIDKGISIDDLTINRNGINFGNPSQTIIAASGDIMIEDDTYNTGIGNHKLSKKANADEVYKKAETVSINEEEIVVAYDLTGEESSVKSKITPTMIEVEKILEVGCNGFYSDAEIKLGKMGDDGVEFHKLSEKADTTYVDELFGKLETGGGLSDGDKEKLDLLTASDGKLRIDNAFIGGLTSQNITVNYGGEVSVVASDSDGNIVTHKLSEKADMDKVYEKVQGLAIKEDDINPESPKITLYGAQNGVLYEMHITPRGIDTGDFALTDAGLFFPAESEVRVADKDDNYHYLTKKADKSYVDEKLSEIEISGDGYAVIDGLTIENDSNNYNYPTIILEGTNDALDVYDLKITPEKISFKDNSSISGNGIEFNTYGEISIKDVDGNVHKLTEKADKSEVYTKNEDVFDIYDDSVHAVALNVGDIEATGDYSSSSGSIWVGGSINVEDYITLDNSGITVMQNDGTTQPRDIVIMSKDGTDIEHSLSRKINTSDAYVIDNGIKIGNSYKGTEYKLSIESSDELDENNSLTISPGTLSYNGGQAGIYFDGERNSTTGIAGIHFNTEAEVFIRDGEGNEHNLSEKANKSYVDEKLGDVEAALDELHSYAQALISGGANK